MPWQRVSACVDMPFDFCIERLLFTVRDLQKKAPIDVDLADPDHSISVQRLLDNGVYEQHTHLWGIEGPESYLDAMYSPITEGQHDRQHAAAESAFKAIKEHFFSYEGKYAKGSAPEGLFKLVRWILKADTAAERTDRVQHAMTSCQDPARPVNWDWAYTLRSIVRDASFTQMRNSQDSYPQVPEEAWSHAGAFEGWLQTNEPAGITVHYVLSVEPLENLLPMDRMTALENIDRLVASCSETRGQARVALHLTESTARYLYLRRVQRSQAENNVSRCEIDGKHGLSQGILDTLAKFNSVELRFLCGLDTGLLSKGVSPDCPLPCVKIRDSLQQPDVVGTDIRGPEAVFKAPECSQVIQELYAFMVTLYRELSRRAPYVLRMHVGESNMFNNLHDPKLEKIGQENLDIVIKILEKMHADSAFQKDKVLIRLGHVTVLTIGQAYRLRQLPHKVCMLELNSRSNLQTFASPDMGHLPILKMLIADALYRFDRQQGKRQTRSTPFNFIDFTCNTDGAGIMHSSMKEEYFLASNVLTHFKDDSDMEDGSRAHVPVSAADFPYLAGSIQPAVTQQVLQDRGLLFVDLIPEVRDMLRSDNFIARAQPHPLSPRKKARHV